MKNSYDVFTAPRLDPNRERMVVFYGRVSTEHEAQLSALQYQMQWYDTQAEMHSNWKIVGKYIDEGITGTQAKKRPAFLSMIEDAKQHKFDLIVTREVCRFARNTVDTLVTTRELRNIGIEVYFVEDNIWTMDGDGELRLTIMATLAQEESRKVSERVKAGQQVSREKGVVYGRGNILGYTRKAGGTYEIDEEQAETVRMIYKMYTEDCYGSKRIADELERLGRKTAMGLSKWHPETVLAILKNPTYTGIQAYGKSHVNNYLEQKRIMNRDRTKYMYVRCGYEPIISYAVFEKAQQKREEKHILTYNINENGDINIVERNRRHPQIVWSRKLRDENDVPFRRQRWYYAPDGSKVYGYLKKKPSLEHPGGFGMGIAEWKFEASCPFMVDYIRSHVNEITGALLKSIEEKKDRKSGIISPLDIMLKIEKLESKLETLTEMRLENEISPEEFQSMKIKIEKEIRQLHSRDRENGKRTELDVEAFSDIKSKLTDILMTSVNEYDVIDKAVSKIVPRTKSIFDWILKIGDGEITITVTVEGRNKSPRVTVSDEWQN